MRSSESFIQREMFTKALSDYHGFLSFANICICGLCNCFHSILPPGVERGGCSNLFAQFFCSCFPQKCILGCFPHKKWMGVLLGGLLGPAVLYCINIWLKPLCGKTHTTASHTFLWLTFNVQQDEVNKAGINTDGDHTKALRPKLNSRQQVAKWFGLFGVCHRNN